MDKNEHIKIVSTNRKVHFNYFLSDFIECGIELKGSEIKSIRNNKVNLDDAYVLIKNLEAYVINMNIAIYEKSSVFNHDPLRMRKLLLHKKEILKLNKKVERQGYTLIPTKIYLRKGKCKVEIALAKGKKLYDKRETIKNRDIGIMLKKALKR